MKKLLNKKGFTLMEMMIVIAIIVILVAISIPSFAGSLEKAYKATDAANFRSAKAAYVVAKMDGKFVTNKTYYYDFEKGEFLEVKDNTVPTHSIGSCDHHDGAYIKVEVKEGVVSEMEWSSGTYKTDCDEA